MKSWAPETDGAARGVVHPAAHHHRRHRCRRRATEPNGLEANYPHKDYSCEMSVWKRDIHPYCTMQNMQDSFSVTASQQWRSVICTSVSANLSSAAELIHTENFTVLDMAKNSTGHTKQVTKNTAD